MGWFDYWNALGSRQRAGVIAGAVLIALTALGLTFWLLHDPYVPLASGLTTERMNELAQELDRAKLSFRIADEGDVLTVPRSELGRARAVTAGGPFEIPANVGLELFKETDFSSTDFAQRINYQRALQGELTRTIQSIAGVRSARVHVILPDGGVFKRDAAKATAAVSVSVQPGKQLTPAQVRGIQRLVAASVPLIKLEDVVVLDESGTSLTRVASESDVEMSSAAIDLKRQVDQYLEGKLARLLQDLVPDGTVSVSVDTALDDKQLRVVTDEPIGARGGSKDADRPTGVLVKERQSQHGSPTGFVQTDGYASADPTSTDWEHEYVVGRRTEHTQSSPGSIKRVSVAVALRGVLPELSSATVEQLITNAVGIDRSRGDSVAVLLLPEVAGERETQPPLPAAGASPTSRPRTDSPPIPVLAIVLAVAMVAVLIAFSLRWRSKTAEPDVDVDALTAKVRQWLNEGARSGRG